MNKEHHYGNLHTILTYIALAAAGTALVLSIVSLTKKSAEPSTPASSFQGPAMAPQTVPAPNNGGSNGNSGFGPGAPSQ